MLLKLVPMPLEKHDTEPCTRGLALRNETCFSHSARPGAMGVSPTAAGSAPTAVDGLTDPDWTVTGGRSGPAGALLASRRTGTCFGLA